MKKFIIKLCKKLLCHFNEHVTATKTVLTYTKLGHDPYLRHDDTCGYCGTSLGMRVERVDKYVEHESPVNFWEGREERSDLE